VDRLCALFPIYLHFVPASHPSEDLFRWRRSLHGTRYLPPPREPELPEPRMRIGQLWELAPGESSETMYSARLAKYCRGTDTVTFG